MSCKNCEERRKLAREALLRSAVGETLTHVVKGAAEMAGIKEKTAMAEREEAVARCEPDVAGNKAGSTDTEQEQD